MNFIFFKLNIWYLLHFLIFFPAIMEMCFKSVFTVALMTAISTLIQFAEVRGVGGFHVSFQERFLLG